MLTFRHYLCTFVELIISVAAIHWFLHMIDR